MLKIFDFYIFFFWGISYKKCEKYCYFCKIDALFLFIAHDKKIAQVIKYHQKKALFVGKKDAKFV